MHAGGTPAIHIGALERSGSSPLRSNRSALIADAIAVAWVDLGAHGCALVRDRGVPCLRGHRRDFRGLAARAAARFVAVVDCLA